MRVVYTNSVLPHPSVWILQKTRPKRLSASCSNLRITMNKLVQQPFSRTSRVSLVQNVSKDHGGGGDNWSYKICKAPVKSSPPTNQRPAFYRPDALPSPNQQRQSTILQQMVNIRRVTGRPFWGSVQTVPALQVSNNARKGVLHYYTVSQIKTPMRTIVHNFVKFLPIFTIFWLADSAGNL